MHVGNQNTSASEEGMGNSPEETDGMATISKLTAQT